GGGGASHITLLNCTISANVTGPGSGQGGGVDSCNATNCVITRNSSGRGGGAEFSNLRNCVLTQNQASGNGGGAENGILVNCTLTGNTGNPGGGTANNTMINSIVYGNRSITSSTSNYTGSTFSYSCTSPLPSGTGNFDANPQLISDG